MLRFLTVALLAFAADAAFGVLQRPLTPPGLRAEVSALEPDVITGTAAAG